MFNDTNLDIHGKVIQYSNSFDDTDFSTFLEEETTVIDGSSFRFKRNDIGMRILK